LRLFCNFILFIYLFIPSFIEASHSLPVGGGNAP